MNRKTLLGIIAIILFDRLLGLKPKNASSAETEPAEEDVDIPKVKIPFLCRNEQYKGVSLPGTKHYRTIQNGRSAAHELS